MNPRHDTAAEPEAARPATPPGALTDRQLADLLQISMATLHRWKAARKLPKPLQLGRLTRYGAAEVEAWIAAGCPGQEAWERLKRKR